LGYHTFQATELNTGRKLKSSQPSGLALIESLYFRAGSETARHQFQRLLGPDQSLRPFVLCDVGHPSVGMDITPEDDIAYESFSPPPLWDAAYSLQRIRLGPKHKNEFVFHPGEEIMIPVQGEVSYHFFWSPGARPPARVVLNSLVEEGSLVRINPQIPPPCLGFKERCDCLVVPAAYDELPGGPGDGSRFVLCGAATVGECGDSEGSGVVACGPHPVAATRD